MQESVRRKKREIFSGKKIFLKNFDTLFKGTLSLKF